MITVPFHQFEIRYTKMPDFQSQIKYIIAYFVPMALDVVVENENSVHRCRYTLTFDDYIIIVTWDRILIKYEGDIKGLNENNSIIEEPFFNLFNKISDIPTFGNVLNCLCASIFIRHLDVSQETAVRDFSSTFLRMENLSKIMNNPSDAAIILDKMIDSKQIILQYGPYLGIADLQKRNIIPQKDFIIEKLGSLGEMAEIKVFETLKNITFTKYKELFKLTEEYKNALWEN